VVGQAVSVYFEMLKRYKIRNSNQRLRFVVLCLLH